MWRRARVGGKAVMTRSDEGVGCAEKFGNHLARIAIADLDRVVRAFLQDAAACRSAPACSFVCCGKLSYIRMRRDRPSRHSRARQMSTDDRSMRYLGVRAAVLAAQSRGEVVG